MRLKKLKIQNIRSYKNQEIEFPEGSVLLSGDIGSGKTTILLAISFSLFGLQPGQRGTSILASDSNTGKITLEAEINSQEVIIERALRRNNGSISQESCAITIDGDRKELSITELKARILELLNYPSEFIKKSNTLYNFTVYSPQEQMKQIILEDSESRLNVLRHVFGIDKYKKIRENTSIVASKLREKCRILQYEIRDLEENKTSFDSKREFILILENKVKEKSQTLDSKIKEKEILEKELEELDSKLEQKRKYESEIEKTAIAIGYKNQEIKRIEKEINSLQDLIKALPDFEEQKLIACNKEIECLKKMIRDLSNSKINLSAEITSLESKQKQDLQKKERLFKIDICPTCLQDVSDTHKNNILNETETELVKTKKKIQALTEEESKVSSDLQNKETLLSQLEEKKYQLELLKSRVQESQKYKEKLEKLLAQVQILEKDKHLLEKHLESLKDSVRQAGKYENLFRVKEKEVRDSRYSEKKIEIEIAETNKEIELTKKEISALSLKIEEKESAKEKLSRTLHLEQWLSSSFQDLVSFTEKNIMLRLRKEFSNLFNKWFSMLTTDAFYVNLDETFTPIITQGDYELDYSFLSGGERTAVALAYRLALNQIINSLFSKINTRDLVILDEPTDGFSGQQLDKVRDILEELNIGQLIIVSHEPKIESFVDNVIKVKKENGKSKTTD